MRVQLTEEEKEIILREFNQLKEELERAIQYIENDAPIFKTADAEFYPVRTFDVGLYHVTKLI